MTQPTSWPQTHSFSEELGAQHGINLDEELSDGRLSVSEIRANLALIQRDDTKLANQSVHPDALNSATLALVASTFLPRGEWVIGTVYAVGNIVEVGTTGSYIAVTAHTAGSVFVTDKAAGKWISLSGTTLAVLAASTSAAGIGSTGGTVQAVLDAKQALDATLTALAALTIAANSVTVGSGADAFTQITLAANQFLARSSSGNAVAKAITDAALALLDDADAAAMLVTLGALAKAGGTMTGEQVLADVNHVSAMAAGFRGAPTVTVNAIRTFGLTDSGKAMLHDETTARAWTIPANASVAFPIGTVIILDNTGNSGGTPGAITLSITTDTLWRGDGTAGTGSRTIAANQVAVIRKTASASWTITGSFG